MILDPSTLLDKVLFDYDLKGVQPNSYDLRLNRVFEIMGGLTLFADGRKVLPAYRQIEPIHTTQEDIQETPSPPFFALRTGLLYQVEFVEAVKIPSYAAAITILRSSMSKSGASGETGLYDSGYEGNCGMTISVKHGCNIQQGASVAQIVFLSADATKLYDGEYLDQRWAERLVVNPEGQDINVDR
jgi:dUTP pyrophosphatase